MTRQPTLMSRLRSPRADTSYCVHSQACFSRNLSQLSNRLNYDQRLPSAFVNKLKISIKVKGQRSNVNSLKSRRRQSSSFKSVGYYLFRTTFRVINHKKYVCRQHTSIRFSVIRKYKKLGIISRLMKNK